MKEAAASTGLSWPGIQRSRGQPSLQTRYEDAPRRHVRTLYAVAAGITTAQRPSWWRPGNGFVEEPIGPAALDAAMVPSLEHLGEIPEGAVVNCAGDDDAAVPKKRCKTEFVSDSLKTWFVQYSQLQAQRCGWSHPKSTQEAVRLAPEGFSEVHQDTPRRWHKQLAIDSCPKTPFHSSTALAELCQGVRLGERWSRGSPFCHRRAV